MKNIFEIIEPDRIYEYPKYDRLLNGVDIDTSYNYVSSTYLNGFINYVNILAGAMIRIYAEDDAEWKAFCDNVEALKDEVHTNVSSADKFDYVVVLAESSDSYWVFDSDKDSSDCKIARISKEHFKDRDEAIVSFNENMGSEDDEFILIDKSLFKGWVTL